MPNLFSTDNINYALIDQFSVEGIGFPDQTMLNPDTGERDSSVLERMIGMTRAFRRMEQAKVKPGLRVMDFQKTSAGRLKLLLKDLHNIHLRLIKKSKRIDSFHSWEKVIFSNIDPTWYEPTGTVGQRFFEFAQEDQEALSAMLEKRLEWVDTVKKWDADLRDFIKAREYIKQLGGMVGILLDQLAAWDVLSDDKNKRWQMLSMPSPLPLATTY